MSEKETQGKGRVVWAMVVVLVSVVVVLVLVTRRPSPVSSGRGEPITMPSTVAAEKHFEFIEKRVADLGAAVPDKGARVWRSPDGTKQAYIVKRGWDTFLVVNGTESPAYDSIYTVAFSPDGRRFAYGARKDEMAFVVCDGEVSPRYKGVGRLGFTPDSRRLVYDASRWPSDNQISFLVLDGKEGKEYPGIFFQPMFSMDNKHVAYGADFKKLVVIDGYEGPRHDDVELLHGGATLGYVVKDGCRVAEVEVDWPPDKADSDYRIVEREMGVVGVLPEPVLSRSMLWGGMNDARHAAAVCAWVKGKPTVYFKGKQSQEYKKVDNRLGSPDNEHIAFRAECADGKQAVVRDCEGEGNHYDEIEDLTFSTHGRLGYRARLGGKWFVVIDGKQGESFASTGVPVFSDNGKACAYVATGDNGSFVVLDGRKLAAYQSVKEIMFSPDSARLAYAVQKADGCFVACDGREGTSWEEVGGILVSRDSKHLLYAARSGDKWFMVVDGVKGPPHDRVWVDKQMDLGLWPDGVFRYLALDNGRESLVEVAWPKDLEWTNGLKPVEP